MGSSACYHLATRGSKVLGLEQFGISHEFGSHAGQSRIIRKAYFENSDYVPLLTRAYENWKALEEETGERLYFKTGLAYFGNPDHVMMQGVKKSASLYNIPLEIFTGSSNHQRFPQFTIPASFEGLWESDAGFVTPEKAIQLYARQAIKKGAEIHSNERILDWKKDGNGVIVTTDKNTYRSQKLIITAGAWAKSLIPGLNRILKITRQFVAWIKPKRWNDFMLDYFPCWLIADEKPGCYYGFPILPKEFGDPQGLKLALTIPRWKPILTKSTEKSMQRMKRIFNTFSTDIFPEFFNHCFPIKYASMQILLTKISLLITYQDMGRVSPSRAVLAGMVLNLPPWWVRL